MDPASSTTAAPVRRDWIFQGNPAIYHTTAALQQLTEFHWRISQYRDDIHVGDRVYLWETGALAGIVAVATVRTEPAIADESEAERAFWKVLPDTGPTIRVLLSIDLVVDPPLPRSVMVADPVLADLPNVRFAQGTNFPLTAAMASRLQESLANWAQRPTPTAAITELPSKTLPRVLKIAPGPEGRYWQDCLAGGFICVGWEEIGDLRDYPDYETFRTAFRRAYPYNGHEATVTRKARELWTLRELSPGDVILANAGTERILGVGRVVDPGYDFRPDLPYPHIVSVAWDASKGRKIPMIRSWFAWTVADIPPDQFARILPDVAAELGFPPASPAAEPGPSVAPQQVGGAAWIVLQSGDAAYRDIEGRAYHFPLGIPNGRRIAPGDVIVVARTAKMADSDGGRLIGVGLVDRVEPEGEEATAWYGWYQALTPPVSFAEVGGDPRNNHTNSITTATIEWVERVLAARGLTLDGAPLVDRDEPLPEPVSRPVPPATPPPARDPRLTMEWLMAQTLWPRDALEAIIETLTDSSPQVVLAGPPGTGKTWVAQRIARYITGGIAGHVRIVQFHPSYSYEQFIEGLRPVVKTGGGIQFERVDGVVLDIVAGMHGLKDRRVLVIDEMNRANLPRVFGELMYLFEYRDEPIALQYSPSWSLPEGLLFLGTMNTADRSIRSLDVALRRRFDVFECPPSADILRRYYEVPGHISEVADLIGGFERLNAALTAALDRHHTIGHTFFLDEHLTAERLGHAWRHKLAPLIEEYFFDQPDLAATFTIGSFWPDATDAH